MDFLVFILNSIVGKSVSILDSFNVGSFLLLQGLGRLGSFALTPDLTLAGFSLLLQGFEQLDLALLIMKIGHLAFSPAASDIFSAESLLSFQALCRCGLVVPLFGCAHLGVLALTMDFATLASLLLIQSLVKSGLALPVPNSASLDTSVFLRQSVHSDVLLPLFGSN